MMIQIAHLLSLADAFQQAAPVSDTTLSFRIFRDSKKLGALRAGSDITTGRFNDAIVWFSENWPASAVWPVAVPRPSMTETAA
jgi:hypothetical protein